MADDDKNKAQQILNDLGQAFAAIGGTIAVFLVPELRNAVRSFAADVGAVAQRTAAWFERIWLYNIAIFVRGATRASKKSMIIANGATFLLLLGSVVAGAASHAVLIVAAAMFLVSIVLHRRLHAIDHRLTPLRWVGATEPMGADFSGLEGLTDAERERTIGLRRAAFRQQFLQDHGTLPAEHSPSVDAGRVVVATGWNSGLLIATCMVAYVFRASDGAIYPFTVTIAIIAVLHGLFAAGIAILIQEVVTGFLLQAVNASVRVTLEGSKAVFVTYVPNVTAEDADAKLGVYRDEVRVLGSAIVAVRKEALIAPAIIGVSLIAWQHWAFQLAMTILMLPAFLLNTAKHGKGMETLESERRNLGILSLILTMFIIVRVVSLVDVASGCYVSGFLNSVIEILNALLGFRLRMPTSRGEIGPFIGFVAFAGVIIWLAWSTRRTLVDGKAHRLSKIAVGVVVVIGIIVILSQVSVILGKSFQLPMIRQACELPASPIIVADIVPADPAPPATVERHIILSSPAPAQAFVTPPPQTVRVARVARTTSRRSFDDPCLDDTHQDYQALLRRDQLCDPDTGRYIGER